MYGIVDCDNCYVSCERVFRPDLNRKPVVVLSNNDGPLLNALLTSQAVTGGQAGFCLLFTVGFVNRGDRCDRGDR